MNRETFARLVPMSTRNLANIKGGKPPSANVLRQLQELRRVVDALAEATDVRRKVLAFYRGGKFRSREVKLPE